MIGSSRAEDRVGGVWWATALLLVLIVPSQLWHGRPVWLGGADDLFQVTATGATHLLAVVLGVVVGRRFGEGVGALVGPAVAFGLLQVIIDHWLGLSHSRGVMLVSVSMSVGLIYLGLRMAGRLRTVAVFVGVAVATGFVASGHPFVDLQRPSLEPVERGTVHEVSPSLLAFPALTNDPLSRHQWNLRLVLDGSTYESIQGDAPRDVVVAVVDHRWGPLSHPELANKTVPGWNFIDGTASLRQAYDGRRPSSSNAHGQCVASILAAETGNGTGIAGVFSRARIMPIQTNLERLAEAIAYAVDNGAEVLLLSGGLSDRGVWPGVLFPLLARDGDLPSSTLYTPGNLQLIADLKGSLRAAYSAGVPVLTPVGNSAAFTIGLVTDDPRVIAVGGHDVSGGIPREIGFAYTVEIFAPSGALGTLSNASAIAGEFPSDLLVFSSSGDYDDVPCAIGERDYAFLTLSSAAAPHVAGAVAMIKSYLPDASVDDVREILADAQVPVSTSGTLMEGLAGRLSLRRLRELIDERTRPQ